MPLNIISNFAANVAHRNLTMSDMAASNSLAKLSAGTRVLGAKDDAAAMAVGSRLAAEIAGLKTAAVNAGQAISMLQVADGAMSQVNDVLVRMKSLAAAAALARGDVLAFGAEVDRSQRAGIELLGNQIEQTEGMAHLARESGALAASAFGAASASGAAFASGSGSGRVSTGTSSDSPMSPPSTCNSC